MTGLGSRLSLRWVRLYTRGADLEARTRRRLEIASDVWEHERNSQAEGRSRSSAEAEILLRCVRGIPADVSWRFQQRSDGGTRLRKVVGESAPILGGAALAAWFFVYGVGINFGEDSASFWWSLASFASGVAVLTGLWLLARAPWIGCLLLVLGALPLGAITLWAIFPPLLASATVVLAVARAGSRSRKAGQALSA